MCVCVCVCTVQQDPQIFQKSYSHLKTRGTRKGDTKQGLYRVPTNVSMCVGGTLRIIARNEVIHDGRYKLDNK